jgi:hypothetical protein
VLRVKPWLELKAGVASNWLVERAPLSFAATASHRVFGYAEIDDPAARRALVRRVFLVLDESAPRKAFASGAN